tara:strand:+ start:1394 stop:1963 length:570 start_codon:yes stop_codon:yes gene_type:complete
VEEKDNKEKISDIELSLITAISSLENKLEELDHNISAMPKVNNITNVNSEKEKEILNKINELEKKISSIDLSSKKEVSVDKNNDFNDTATKGRFKLKNKGYAAAEILRLKRIENIEKSINDLTERFNTKYGENQSNFENKKNTYTNNYEVTTEEFFVRSRRIYFGFLFSIIIVFLLIILVNEISILSLY